MPGMPQPRQTSYSARTATFDTLNRRPLSSIESVGQWGLIEGCDDVRRKG